MYVCYFYIKHAWRTLNHIKVNHCIKQNIITSISSRYMYKPSRLEVSFSEHGVCFISISRWDLAFFFLILHVEARFPCLAFLSLVCNPNTLRMNRLNAVIKKIKLTKRTHFLYYFFICIVNSFELDLVIKIYDNINWRHEYLTFVSTIKDGNNECN